MIKQSFNLGWLAGLKQSVFASLAGAAPDIKPVTLPYDALRERACAKSSTTTSECAACQKPIKVIVEGSLQIRQIALAHLP